MLDTETKRRIDTARDILVGKVPDPKSQVEQITIALIYKFMDDMDKEAVSFGGKPTFFTGEYEPYSWTNIFDPKVGGHEMLSLYSEAIVKLNLNPSIPQLFRDIFKNAYLPYRDPETLKLFLKTINEFHYDHSEMLGDAFEYLLSVLGSQGDAGQFRTPRHIIDFIVEIIQPQKTETILDPACGTAGFLISSYRYILQTNSNPPAGRAGKSKGDLLTPDDRKKLMKNFTGYDISPDMVRLSLVNMYLHGFITPNIYEYDTLTSEDHWNDYFDVIIANPPFMSPKGGIKPHKKFTMQANRSELLFVDYIAEHIHPTTGRAGIIVPEGIIFQSAKAYKALRKMLVDKHYLYAVVSLPAGVFNPYSGVKTSILLLDKTLARKTVKLLFVKIENDGFDLGAQRREIDKNDLPEALNILQKVRTMITDDLCDDYEKPLLEWIQNQSNPLIKKIIVQTVAKKKIGEKDDYNLSIDRYRENGNARQSDFELVRLGDICEIRKGSSITKKDTVEGKIPVIAGGQQPAYFHSEANRTGETITVSSSGAYAGFVNYFTEPIFASDCTTIQTESNPNLNCRFLFLILKSHQDYFYGLQKGGGQPHVYAKDFADLQIPLPPLSIQQQIVSKIEGWQKIIDGAKQVVENYKPQIEIDESWEKVELGNLCKTEYGYTETAKEKGEARYVRITDISEDGTLKETDSKFVDLTNESKQSLLKKGDLVVARTGATYGKTLFFNEDYPSVFASYLIRLNFHDKKILNKFYWYFTQSKNYLKQKESLVTGGGQPQFNANAIIQIVIPLPPISIQQEIVKRIEKEQEMINTNKQLITIFEQKIKDEINKLWKQEAKGYS